MQNSWIVENNDVKILQGLIKNLIFGADSSFEKVRQFLNNNTKFVREYEDKTYYVLSSCGVLENIVLKKTYLPLDYFIIPQEIEYSILFSLFVGQISQNYNSSDDKILKNFILKLKNQFLDQLDLPFKVTFTDENNTIINMTEKFLVLSNDFEYMHPMQYFTVEVLFVKTN